MKTSQILRVIWLSVLLLLPVSELVAQESRPKREFRGAWIQCVNGQFLGLGTQEMQRTLSYQLDELQKDGVNAIIFQVRAECDALYASRYEPWSRFLTGRQGTPPSPYWDPLQWMIDECHRRGMELHAWINPYRAKTKDTRELAVNHIAVTHPERVFDYDGLKILDPGQRENCDYSLRIVGDIVSRYDVDGLHIDDYFYPSTDESVDKVYYDDYKKNGGKLFHDKWRLDVISSFVSQMYTAIKSENKDCVFSISPAGNINNNYEEEYADVERWCSERGYCDWIIPQLYYGFEDEAVPFDKACDNWSKLDTIGAVCMIYGIAAYKINDSDEEFDVGNGIIEKEISAAKKTDNYGGVAFFSYTSLTNPDFSEEFKNIKSSVFTETATEEEGEQGSGDAE